MTASLAWGHYLETIDPDPKGRIRETFQLVLYQDTNEQTHEDIFAIDLNGLKNWGDRFLARHIGVIIYWVFAITTLIDYELPALLGEAVEVEVVKTYRRMLIEQSNEWLNQPAVPTALRYWNKPNSMWRPRGDRQPALMREVVEAIVKDESDHVHVNAQKSIAFWV